MTLANRIISARMKRGWTQKTLASLLEASGIMSQQSLSALESGKAKTSRHVWKIAAVLGVSPRWLAEGEGEMEDDETRASMPLPVASNEVQPLLARIYQLDQQGKLPPQLVEGILQILAAIDQTKPNSD